MILRWLTRANFEQVFIDNPRVTPEAVAKELYRLLSWERPRVLKLEGAAVEFHAPYGTMWNGLRSVKGIREGKFRVAVEDGVVTVSTSFATRAPLFQFALMSVAATVLVGVRLSSAGIDALIPLSIFIAFACVAAVAMRLGYEWTVRSLVHSAVTTVERATRSER